MGLQGTTSSQESSATTSHSVSLPGSIASGDLLVILFAITTDADEANTPSGWTERATGGSTFCSTYLYTKSASGSEGSTQTITTNDTVSSSHVVLHFRDVDWGGLAAESTATSTSMAHGALLAPGVDARYVSWGCWEGSATVSAYPSDYGNGQTEENQFGCNLAAAVSNLTGSVPSNKTYTLSSSQDNSGQGFYVTEATTVTSELDTATVSVSAGDIDSGSFMLGLAQVNVSAVDFEFPLCELASVSVTAHPMAVQLDPIPLETATVSVKVKTQFGAYRMLKEIKPVDWSAGTFPLTCIAPDDLENGDYFGMALTEDVAVGMDLSFDAGDYEWAKSSHGSITLSNKGEYVVFRYMAGLIYRDVWDY